MTLIHIYKPKGHFIGQVRHYGARKWKTVTGKCKSAEVAVSKAALDKSGWFRIRVLFVDSSGWYEPHITFEGSR